MRQIGYKQRHNKYSKTYCAAFTRTSDGIKLNIFAFVFILENDTYLYLQKERNSVKTFLILKDYINRKLFFIYRCNVILLKLNLN